MVRRGSRFNGCGLCHFERMWEVLVRPAKSERSEARSVGRTIPVAQRMGITQRRPKRWRNYPRSEANGDKEKDFSSLSFLEMTLTRVSLRTYVRSLIFLHYSLFTFHVFVRSRWIQKNTISLRSFLANLTRRLVDRDSGLTYNTLKSSGYRRFSKS